MQLGESRYFAGIQLNEDKSSVTGGSLTENVIFLSNVKNAAHFGIYVAKKYRQWFYLQLELNYSHYGFQKTYADTFRIIEMNVNQDIDMGFIEIPLLAKCKMPKNSGLVPSIYFGPAASLSISSKDKFDSTSIMRSEPEDYVFFNSGEGRIANFSMPIWSIVYGGELSYQFGKVSLLINIRYRSYISDILKHIAYGDKPTGTRILADFNENPDEIILDKLSFGFGLYLDL